MNVTELMPVLLIAIFAVVLANLAMAAALWWRHASLSARVARLEIHREHGLSQPEVRGIYERLASIEGQIHTTNRLVHTVQEHLMEKDR